MNVLLEALPGEKLPVSEVMASLGRLWEGEGAGLDQRKTDFRASQMNVILHCGLDTKPDELRKRFDTLLEMGHRYPCRIIVLCPDSRADHHAELESKIYSQCYIGERGRQHVCIEGIVLSYVPSERGFLENQVSIWLDNDLPTYHWLHRVPVDRVKSYGKSFLQECKRIVYDSSVEPEGYAEQVRAITNSGPESTRWRDLAHSRGLPLRQSVGQFLSAYDPALLVNGLTRISLKYRGNLKGEAHCLLAWAKGRLTDCAGKEPFNPELVTEVLSDEDETSLLMEWSYDNGHQFHWWVNLDTELSVIKVNYGQGEQVHPLSMKLLAPAESLGEAFFF